MARRNYREGQWFLIPVPDEYLQDAPDHRFGAGLVARGKRGTIVFAYIFGPWQGEPLPEDLANLKPGGELLTLLMWDDQLRSGEFPLLGVDDEFSRDRWPMPEFSMYMGGDNPASAVRTSDDEPFSGGDQRPITPAEARKLPEWAVGGFAKAFMKLADPGARGRRLADSYGRAKAQPEGESAPVPEVEVHFVIPCDAERLVEQLRETLESRGWEPSVAPPKDPLASIWVTGTRPAVSYPDLAALDQEMEAIAVALPGIEYDGHGINLPSG